MYNGLALFKMASARAAHAAAAQGLVAQNIANSDTPGYAARRLTPFEVIADDSGNREALKTSREGHVVNRNIGADGAAKVRIDRVDSAPNGNAVSVETEMMHAAMLKQDHDLALAAYRGGMTLLRTVIGRTS